MPEVIKDNSHNIILQPETRLISLELLAIKVKGIYARLIIVKAKCIKVDQRLLASLT
jgi:hypothetical protein